MALSICLVAIVDFRILPIESFVKHETLSEVCFL